MNIPDPAPVVDLIEAFQRSKTMFAAVTLGVFDTLHESAANAAVANTVPLQPALPDGLRALFERRVIPHVVAFGHAVREGSHRWQQTFGLSGHDWPEDRIADLLRKIHAGLTPGGALLILGPVSAHMQSLTMLICTQGKERNFAEYREPDLRTCRESHRSEAGCGVGEKIAGLGDIIRKLRCSNTLRLHFY